MKPMSRLAAQGLLEPQAGGGMVITSPSAAAVGRSMTSDAARGQPASGSQQSAGGAPLARGGDRGRAAQQRTDADLAHMAALLTEAAEAQHDPIRFPALDVDFHMALARATHNELFVLLMEAVSDVLVGFRRLSYQVSSMPARSLHHHQAVYAQVTAGSAEGARDAMRNHLAEAEQTVREAQLIRFIFSKGELLPMTTIALFGAAGKIGTRIANRLRHTPEFDTLYVESGEVGLARLAANGLTATEKADRLRPGRCRHPGRARHSARRGGARRRAAAAPRRARHRARPGRAAQRRAAGARRHRLFRRPSLPSTHRQR